MPSTLRAAACAALLSLCPVHAVIAGPLNPPAGPITSTQKPLTEVEPRIAVNAANTPGDSHCVFKITQPGSYYLSTNVVGVSGKNGVAISASNVTLDLAGFDVVGVVGSLVGVSVGDIDTPEGIEIHSGTVRDWGGDGVNLAAAGTTSATVRNVRVSGNGASGIRAGVGTLVAGCAAYQNVETGILTGFGSSIIACVANSNTGNGIGSSTACSIIDSVCYSNGNHGFVTGSGGTVSRCTAYNNQASGIEVITGVHVSGNACRFNGNDGIRAASGCVVIDNVCSNNGQADPAGGADVHATGDNNRIEANTCISQDRGVDVDNAGNIILRNTCSNNGVNWAIAANNVYGPIINRSSPASAAVNGDAATSSLGSTDANANFTY